MDAERLWMFEHLWWQGGKREVSGDRNDKNCEKDDKNDDDKDRDSVMEAEA